MVSTTLQARMAMLRALGAKKFTLPYQSIPEVFSAKALEEHLKLYQGYKETLKRIDAELETMSKADVPKKTAWDSPFRAIKQAETYALGGIILHELYFHNLTPKTSDCKGLEIERLIKRDFGTLHEWKNCMRGSLIEARGWVVFTCDQSGDYRILMMDAHDCGAMFGQTPLVVLDAQEHNYWMDWGADKVGCIDVMLSHLNWQEINNRYLACKLDI